MGAILSQPLSRLRQASQAPDRKHVSASPYANLTDSSVESIARTSHRHRWDEEIGSTLSTMLQLAGYAPTSETIHRAFFAERVSRSLGPHAADSESESDQAWQSFMTDDHTPVELSWSWSEKSALPAVRYAVEPIGWRAGTAEDRFNSKAIAGCLGDSLPWAPSLDLQWYRHFLQAFGVSAAEDLLPDSTKDALKADSNPSQAFIAFDLDQSSVVVKYYFLPAVKAALTNTTKLDLVTDSILSLPGLDSGMRAALDTFLAYIDSCPAATRPEAEIFAIDCIDPADSRLKIYFRSPETTFSSMIDAMSLGGRLPEFSECTIACIKDLWCQCFGVENEPGVLSQPLEQRNHRTSGLLYYVELKMNSSVPSTKVYLPVRHYAQDDDQIAKGVSSFLANNQKTLKGGMSYYEAVSQLCTHRQLKDGLGFHTYITCAVKGSGISVNAYFNPETYSRRNS